MHEHAKFLGSNINNASFKKILYTKIDKVEFT